MFRRSIVGLLLAMCLHCMSSAHATFIEKCKADGAQAQACAGAFSLHSMRICIGASDFVPSLITFRRSVRYLACLSTLSSTELILAVQRVTDWQ